MSASRAILRECTIRGLIIRADALRIIEDHLLTATCTINLIEAITSHMNRRTTRVVNETVVKELLEDLPVALIDEATAHKTVELLDAWSKPTIHCAPRKLAIECSEQDPTSRLDTPHRSCSWIKHGSAIAKANSFRVRHELCRKWVVVCTRQGQDA